MLKLDLTLVFLNYKEENLSEAIKSRLFDMGFKAKDILAYRIISNENNRLECDVAITVPSCQSFPKSHGSDKSYWPVKFIDDPSLYEFEPSNDSTIDFLKSIEESVMTYCRMMIHFKMYHSNHEQSSHLQEAARRIKGYNKWLRKAAMKVAL